MMGPFRVTAIVKWVTCYLVPVLATVVLLVLNIHGLYIGGELSGNSGQDEWKLSGLELATLLFYFLVLASVRHINSAVTQLLDDRHWSALSGDTQNFGQSGRTPFFTKSLAPRTWLVRLISGCSLIFCISVLFLAPRAMIPELRNWEAGGTKFRLNATLGNLWPSRLDGIRDLGLCLDNSSCRSLSIDSMGRLLSYWPQTDSSLRVMPEQISLMGKRALRKMEVRFRGPFDYQPPLTSATVPSAQIADAVAELAMYWSEANINNCAAKKVNFCYYNDIEFAVKAFQPVVYVRCNSNDINETPRFPRLDRGPRQFPLVGLDRNMLNTSLDNTSSPVTWIELPQKLFGPSSIGAVVSLPGSNQDISRGQLLACTVDARWADSVSKVAYSSGPMMTFGSPVNWFTSGRFQTGHHAWTQIEISAQWAQNADIMLGENTSVYSNISRQIANGITTQTLYVANAVEAVIAMMLAESISRTMSTASIQGTLKSNNDWMGEMLPKRAFGDAGDAFDYPQSQNTTDSKFEMQTTVNGYGYGLISRRTPAVVMLSFYLVVVSGHMMIRLWKLFYPSESP